jgi:DNA-binding response OmpR family regulator
LDLIDPKLDLTAATITSPLALEGLMTVDEQPPADAPASWTHRLWILEDDSELCRLLVKRCTQQGWLLEPFHHPRALDQALQDSAPDLLLLDQMLPLKSGLDVLDGLRRLGHRFPVLMLSALNAASDRIAGLEHGADDYVGKPFVFRELQLRIERLLQAQPAPISPGAPEADDTPVDLLDSPLQASGFWIGATHFDPGQLSLKGPGGHRIRLTRGDTALLVALCREPDAVVSRQRLARASGSLVDIRRSRTIDVRMSRLRRLLQELEPEGNHLEACRGTGYRLTGVRAVQHLNHGFV